MTLATQTDRFIDARGMPCPGPLMALIGAIREGEVGDAITVLSTDQGSTTDIPAWVRKARHELVEVAPEDGYARFVVKKAR
jgi:tRNA 2-thiouridine synthesizing protein A